MATMMSLIIGRVYDEPRMSTDFIQWGQIVPPWFEADPGFLSIRQARYSVGDNSTYWVCSPAVIDPKNLATDVKNKTSFTSGHVKGWNELLTVEQAIEKAKPIWTEVWVRKIESTLTRLASPVQPVYGVTGVQFGGFSMTHYVVPNSAIILPAKTKP